MVLEVLSLFSDYYKRNKSYGQRLRDVYSSHLGGGGCDECSGVVLPHPFITL